MRLIDSAFNRISTKVLPFLHFEFDGSRLNYFVDPYNSTQLHERAVEIPIAQKVIFEADSVLEIGNVMKHYFPLTHDVVDKFEKAPGVINCDVREFSTAKRYDLILSVSTLEHVAWDEQQNPEGFYDALRNLRSLLTPNGKIVATWALGYNLWLDTELRNGRVKFSDITCFKRISKLNTWKLCDFSDINNSSYNSPYNHGNGLVVLTFTKEPLP